ncbi:MAG TPA: hypothetical protein VIK48_01110 [Candidatus Manganitrophaceae bacterium]
MYREEKTFNLRFSLSAEFPEEVDGEEDDYAWLQEWEREMKPQLLKALFASLRRYPSWKAHIRNRGVSAEDEIEIVLEKETPRRSEV